LLGYELTPPEPARRCVHIWGILYHKSKAPPPGGQMT
jgi:hypothetical protein